MVLTYSQDESRPHKDWVLKTDQGLDGDSLSYLDRMERNQEEEYRREREKRIMEEGRTLWWQKKKEEEETFYKDRLEINELARQRMFGRPGHGAPTQDIRKKKFTEHQLDINLTRSQSLFGLDQMEDYPNKVAAAKTRREMSSYSSELDYPDALSFGRPGYGAPVRTKSGRLRTTVIGNPEIRFQANESVQKSICNNIRYATDASEKAAYHKMLDMQVQEKRAYQNNEHQADISALQIQDAMEGSQWGKPGPGGPYWRNSAVTGQGFFDKMGWSGSADPRKRQREVKRMEAEDIKREMTEIEKAKVEQHREVHSDEGLELVPLMKEKYTGKPKKDPSTGYMMNHSLHSTDITKHADKKGPQPWHSFGNKRQYWEQLTGQVSEKLDNRVMAREKDLEQQRQHYQSWETYWGRPGYGAPNTKLNKENLMKMLHYPTNNNVPSSVELITLERLPVR